MSAEPEWCPHLRIWLMVQLISRARVWKELFRLWLSWWVASYCEAAGRFRARIPHRQGRADAYYIHRDEYSRLCRNKLPVHVDITNRVTRHSDFEFQSLNDDSFDRYRTILACPERDWVKPIKPCLRGEIWARDFQKYRDGMLTVSRRLCITAVLGPRVIYRCYIN